MTKQAERIATYRAKAIELRNFAAASSTEELRLGILEIADKWEQLAERLDTIGSLRGVED